MVFVLPVRTETIDSSDIKRYVFIGSVGSRKKIFSCEINVLLVVS